MVLYLTVILISMAIICVANNFLSAPLFNFDLRYIIIAVVLLTISVIIVDGIFATIVRWLLPEKWFDVNKKIFKANKKECKFYEKIGIKRWKDKVLELGGFTKFHKNKLGESYDIEYVSKFIIESNYGIIVHVACIMFGYLIIFFYPLKYFLCFGVPIATVNAILNFLPLMILRYNLPKLHVLYAYIKRKQDNLDQKKSNIKDVA